MHHLGFKPCLVNLYLWILATMQPDGFKFYAYVLLYVDDVMVIHHNSLSILAWFDKYLKMKPGLIGDPSMYCGATLKKM
jgi:hypothetical protein